MRSLTTANHAAWLAIAAGLLFATGGAAVKACPSFSAWHLAAGRSLLASILFLVLLPSSRRALADLRRNPKLAGIATAYAATLTLYIAANKYTTAANAIFLQSTAPLFVLVWSPFLLRERPARRDIVLAAAIAVGTVILFVGSDGSDTDTANAFVTAPDITFGNLLGLGAGICWALTITGLRGLARSTQEPDKPPSRGTDSAGSDAAGRAVLLGNYATVLIALPIALLSDTPLPTDAPQVEWWLLGYLGLVQVGFAYVLLTKAMAHISALTIALLLMIEPAANPVITWLVHGEVPSTATLAGGAIILIALFGHGLAARSAATSEGLIERS